MTNDEPTSRREFIGTLSAAAAAAAAGGSLGAAVPAAEAAASAPAASLLAAAALPTVGCFLGANLTALNAEAAETGKPVMTPANVNTGLPHPSHGQFEPMLRDLRTDPARYLQARFTLTPIQVEGLRRLTPQDRAVLSSAIDDAIRTRTPLQFVLGSSGARRQPGAPPFSLSKQVTPQGVHVVVASDFYSE